MDLQNFACSFVIMPRPSKPVSADNVIQFVTDHEIGSRADLIKRDTLKKLVRRYSSAVRQGSFGGDLVRETRALETACRDPKTEIYWRLYSRKFLVRLCAKNLPNSKIFNRLQAGRKFIASADIQNCLFSTKGDLFFAE
jgi:hypothetical protein